MTYVIIETKTNAQLLSKSSLVIGYLTSMEDAIKFISKKPRKQSGFRYTYEIKECPKLM